MPLPIIAWIGIAAAGALGIGAHESAKDTNARAQSTTRDAQKIYDDAKASLEQTQKMTKTTLVDLVESRKEIMGTSVKQFLMTYDKIKNVMLRKSAGIDEIDKFNIDEQAASKLHELADIYESMFATGAGAAAGTLVTLALTGSTSILSGALGAAGTLGTAGTALLAGNVGVAASLAGAAITPLAAIAAPAYLVTGIVADMKADKNMEKANAIYSKAKADVEKMKTAETLCRAIDERAKMFNDLLISLNQIFSHCTEQLEKVVQKKSTFIKFKKLTEADFSDREIALIAITRSLAGAVTAVIDVPILSDNGQLTSESEALYRKTSSNLPALEAQVKAIDLTKNSNHKLGINFHLSSAEERINFLFGEILCDILALVTTILLAWRVSSYYFTFSSGRTIAVSLIWIICLNFIAEGDNAPLIRWAKKACLYAINGCFIVFFFIYCKYIININNFIWVNLFASITALVLHQLILPKLATLAFLNRLCYSLANVFLCLFFFSLGLFTTYVLSWLGIPFWIDFIVGEFICLIPGLLECKNNWKSKKYV